MELAVVSVVDAGMGAMISVTFLGYVTYFAVFFYYTSILLSKIPSLLPFHHPSMLLSQCPTTSTSDPIPAYIDHSRFHHSSHLISYHSFHPTSHPSFNTSIHAGSICVTVVEAGMGAVI